MRILAADIGGTYARFGLLEQDDAGRLLLRNTLRLETAGASSFSDLLGQAASRAPQLAGLPPELPLDAAAFALAGPIERNGASCRPPNIAWDVDLTEILPLLKARRVYLLNDFTAQAMACSQPDLVEARLVRPGTPVEAPVAVMGAGTGLGKCLLLPGPPPSPLPSEGGHSAFPFIGREEEDFAEFARQRTGRRLIGDVVVSGLGLQLLHAFHLGQWLEPREVAAQLHPAHPVECWFSRFYGRACQIYVLETLALGGLFISGGVASKNPNLLTNKAFLEEFHTSEAHAALLERLPIHLVSSRDSALYGAALYALGKMGC